MKAVLHTNVIVSGVLAPNSPPDLILRAARKGAFELLTSLALLEELRRVLVRPRIAGRLGWTTQQLAAFLAAFVDSVTTVFPAIRLELVEADPADNRVLEAAIPGSADYVVTGDRHLLALKTLGQIPIVMPARFLAIVTVQEDQ